MNRFNARLTTSKINAQYKHLGLFIDVWYPGQWFDGGAKATLLNVSHYLADDGLHLGRDGNKRLDEALFDHLMG